MKKRNVIFALLLLLFPGHFAFGQGYNIDVKIMGDKQPAKLYLKCFYGYSEQMIDSAQSDANQIYQFKGKQKLKPGIYFIQAPDKNMFEVIIDKDTDFSLSCKAEPFGDNLRFQNSKENEVYVKLVDELNPVIAKLQTQDSLYQSPNRTAEEQQADIEQIQLLSQDILAIRKAFQNANPDHVMSLLFRIQTDIEVPAPPKALVTSVEGEYWQYQYYKDHFFDSIDFSDVRLIRIPTTHQRLVFYLDNIIPQVADSVISTLENLIPRFESNPELYQYFIEYLNSKYEHAPIVGQDAVWVYLVENYYLNNKTPWASKATLENLKNRLAKVKPLLIGQIPPEMWYPDSNNIKDVKKMLSLFSLSSDFSIIIFFETGCTHCKREMEKLKELYKRKDELGFDVIAVSRDPDINAMKTYMKDMQLPWLTLYGGGGPAVRKREDVWTVDAIPTIYILDKDKRIVSKKINVDRIENIIKNYKNN